jgi:uncharacterized membrane protein YgcG
MLLRNRCMMLVSLVALAGSVACSAPEPPKYEKPVQVKTGVVFNAPATKATQAKLGITRWHAIVESQSGAVVIDGSDAKGKVKFSTAFRLSKDGKSYEVTSYAQKGAVKFDMKTGKLVSNTMQVKDWSVYSKALAADWGAFHRTTPYGIARNIALGLGAVAATIAIAVALPPVLVAAGVITAGTAAAAGTALAAATLVRTVLTAGAIVAEIVNQTGDAKGAEAPAEPTKAEDPAEKLEEQTEKVEEATPDADKPADPEAPPADPANPENPADPANPETPGSEQPGTPDEQPAGGENPSGPSETPSEGPAQGTDLPPDSSGGNLDTTGGGIGDTGGGDTGGGDTGGGDTGGGDTGGGDTGGGDTGGGDTGGGDTGGGDTGGGDTGGGEASGGDTGGGDYAKGSCRKAACSKTTKLCICTKY